MKWESGTEIVLLCPSKKKKILNWWTLKILEGWEKTPEIIMPPKTSDGQQVLVFDGQKDFPNTCETNVISAKILSFK